jgi:hypothetical protein
MNLVFDCPRTSAEHPFSPALVRRFGGTLRSPGVGMIFFGLRGPVLEHKLVLGVVLPTLESNLNISCLYPTLRVGQEAVEQVPQNSYSMTILIVGKLSNLAVRGLSIPPFRGGIA